MYGRLACKSWVNLLGTCLGMQLAYQAVGYVACFRFYEQKLDVCTVFCLGLQLSAVWLLLLHFPEHAQ